MTPPAQNETRRSPSAVPNAGVLCVHGALALALLASGGAGCDRGEGSPAASADVEAKAPELPFGLSRKQADQTLYRIDDHVVTVGQFARQLARQSDVPGGRLHTAEGREKAVEAAVRFELLAREAISRGYAEPARVTDAFIARALENRILEERRLERGSPEAARALDMLADDLAQKAKVTYARQRLERVKLKPDAQPAGDADEAARRALVLASFEGGQVTIGQLEDELDQRNHAVRDQVDSVAKLDSYLEQRVRLKLLSLEGSRRGLDKGVALELEARQSAVQVMLAIEVDRKIGTEDVTAQEVERFYREHLDEFRQPDTRRVSYMTFPTREAAARARAQAESGEAHPLADPANAARPGGAAAEVFATPYFGREDHARPEGESPIPAEVAAAAFALEAEVGALSPPVELSDGFAVVKLTGMRPAFDRKLSEVELPIRKRLVRAKRDQAVADLVRGLRQTHRAEVHPDRLAPLAQGS